MARHLRAKGFEVMGTDISPEALARAESVGIRTAATAREVAAVSDFVIIVVGFDSEVEQVLFGRDGVSEGSRPGLIVGVASTVAPRTMRRLKDRADRAGIIIVDMPLTRGERAAETGTMLTMVGGDAAVFEAIKPALQTFADAIFHVGDVGAGQVGKMVNNLILWACISANHEGLKLAKTLGVDPERLRVALNESSAGNWALKTRVEEMPMPWAEKDMRIVLSEADALRLSVPLCGVVTEVVKAIKVERGWPTPSEQS
jgi:3-hydroxyisobutyrate dehydrogenase-like beta-hydroxyacid dehydrogenase